MAIKYGRPIEARLAPVEAKAAGLELSVRPRRNRKADWTRRSGPTFIKSMSVPARPHGFSIGTRATILRILSYRPMARMLF